MNAHRTALVVDDERDIRELLVMTLGRMGLRITTAATLAEARHHLADAPRFDLCITDMRLPDGSGIALVQEITQAHPHIPVAMITAFGSMEMAVQALKAGAFDFVAKPVDLTVLRGLVNQALQLRASNDGERAERKPPAPSSLLGDAPCMQDLRITIAKVARSQAPVHIAGESGVGKELVARTIHQSGGRAAAPFIAVNCGAIPGELMESEFFGHRKGSFTGAHADAPGLFQSAHGGTLFLDEVAELPLPMQVKLLRAIQEKSVRPVGASTEVPVDVRILSATHKDLSQLVAEGLFRHDLFYRINVIELAVPPLRQRRDDLPALSAAILERLSSTASRPAPCLTPAALDALVHYPFPGNVRELENVLERAMALSDGDQIDVTDLRLPTASTASASADSPVPSAPLPGKRVSAENHLPDYIDQMERDAITKALEATRWNKTKAAAQLGITFRALRYKLKKLGME